MKKFQVAVVGINTIFGGTSALLLKQSPFIKCLKLYDQKNVEAAIDICAINTQCNVKMYLGKEQLENAFEGADIIVISDESNEAVMSLDSHLMTAAGNYKNYAKAIARASPQAIIVVASTPVNNLLPIMSQLLVKHGCYNHNKVVGSTLVDTIRASSILASHLNLDPKEVVLPVIGGSSERTRVPVFSQSRPFFSLKKNDKSNLIMNIRRGDAQVLANKGSPEVLNRAYSTVRFLNSIMAGLRGDPNVTDIALCRTDQVPGVDYFSLPVIFGKDGIVKRFGVPKTTDVEDEMVEEAIVNVKKDADKAAYIVRGAIELPEQKYLSSNDRASSDKEMFDLYVKCLPKPVDNKQDSISDYESKKATNYSFKNVIKKGPSINPMSVPHNKSFQRTVLKNVTSEDSFLKSTRFFPSPLQNPILILEPMECPLAPRDPDRSSELLDFEEGGLEAEENYILHEKNLAKNGKGNMVHSDHRKNTDAKMTPTRRSPLSSNERTQMKTVDPIAKLKDQFGSRCSVRNVYIRPSSNLKSPEQSSAYADQSTTEEVHDEDFQQTTTRFEQSQQPTMHRSKREEKVIGEEEISSEKERITACEPEECSNVNTGTKNSPTSFVYDARSERSLPVYNIYNRKAPMEAQNDSYGTFEEEGEPQEIAVDDTVKDEKYRKMVNRLFKNLGGLNDGVYLPLKSSERSKSRCRQSFTESVVRSKSHWASTNQQLQSKPPFKIKLAESPLDSEQDFDNSNYYQKNLQFKKARKPVPKVKSHFIQSEKNTASRSVSMKQSASEVHEEEIVNNTEEFMNVVCPKCHNKMSCPPVKTVKASEVKSLEQIPQRSTESVAKTKREPEMKKSIVYTSPRPDCDKTYFDSGERGDENIAKRPSPDSNAYTTSLKTPRETELQEERLRKLKEKINQKLIPLLNNSRGMHKSTDSVGSKSLVDSGSNSMTSTRRTDSVDPSYYEHNTKSKEKKASVGIPFIVGKEAIVSQKEKVCESKSQGSIKHPEADWQGVPFVVKNYDAKAEGKEAGLIRPLDLKKSDEKSVSKQAGEVSPECSHKSDANNKKSSKTTNKLQLLGTSSKLGIKPEIGETIAELIDSEGISKDNKQSRLKKIILDLRSEDVQSYMQARLKGKFERSQQREMIAENISNEKKDRHTNNVASDEKSATVAELAKGQVIASSPTQFHTKPQPSNQTRQSAAEVSSKPATLADPKSNINTVESKRSENKNGVTVSSKAEPVPKSFAERAVLVTETPAKSEEQLEALATSPIINTLNPSAENTEEKDETIQNSEPVLRQTDCKADKNLSTMSQPAKVLRDSIVSTKSDGHLKPNSILNLVFGTQKSLSKLQLLAKARESKLNSLDGSCSVDGKLRNVWEKTLNGKSDSARPTERKSHSKNARDINSAGTLGKKSAAVKMANVSTLNKPPTYKVKLKAPKTSKILDGLTFPSKKIRRKTHNNLLKELAATAVQRKSRRTTELVPEKTVRRGRSSDPSDQVQLYKKLVRKGTSFSENLKGDVTFGSLSAEYSREGEKLAKLASEVMMKRKLTRPQTVGSKLKLGDHKRKSRIKIKKQKHPSNSLVRNLRNQWTDYGTENKSERESRIRKSADNIQSKLISMPHVRHQIEHFEPPLGPLEVQPGLAHLSWGKIGCESPSSDNSWESVLFNEYARSNLLPSLKDTRENFYLEE